MGIWVLWEDQRGSTRGFGPHDLLLMCLADDLGQLPFQSWWWREVKPLPKKGSGNVLIALRHNLSKLRDEGEVVAVLDRDKAHKLTDPAMKPSACRAGLLKALRDRAPGPYELIFLEQNIETLVMACCKALGKSQKQSKPRPDQRDALLKTLAFQPGSEQRKRVRAEVPSFDRLVRKVGELVAGF